MTPQSFHIITLGIELGFCTVLGKLPSLYFRIHISYITELLQIAWIVLIFMIQYCQIPETLEGVFLYIKNFPLALGKFIITGLSLTVMSVMTLSAFLADLLSLQ